MAFDEAAHAAELAARAQDAAEAFAAFVRTIAALRHPVSGCPWDLEQDHKSLRKYMLEEAYEAAAAMDAGDDTHMCEELGDVLLQVVLNAQLARDRAAFDVRDVIRGIDAKMRRRHPHVFAPSGQGDVTSGDVRRAWETIKADEKKSAGAAPAKSYFAAAEGVAPASSQAVKIGKLAAKIRFDWPDPAPVLSQLRSEVEELAREVTAPRRDPAALEAEIGDVFFTLAQLCRHVGVDAETAALGGNLKFLRRFRRVEALAKARGKDVSTASQDELEALWQEAKVQEKAGRDAAE